MRKELIFGFGILLLALLSRFLPHPPNFTPLLAIALFGGAVFKNKKLALALPIVAVFLSDLVLGLHESMIAVYLCLGLFMYAGTKINRKSSKQVISYSLVAAVVFFLVTNFSVWAFTAMYDKSLAGLFESYAMGLPFFRWNALSTLIYSGVLFGAYNLFEKYALTNSAIQTVEVRK
jgi:hypothetical protein